MSILRLFSASLIRVSVFSSDQLERGIPARQIFGVSDHQKKRCGTNRAEGSLLPTVFSSPVDVWPMLPGAEKDFHFLSVLDHLNRSSPAPLPLLPPFLPSLPLSPSSFRCEIYLLRQRLGTPRCPHDMVQSSCEIRASSMHWDFAQRRHRVNLPFLTV